jgi:alkanesulfonate monooxygenase SsuD/methylene tetrahydromethanopterin reductase-like flavin-dependent oxidoreductase (luciferase family)
MPDKRIGVVVSGRTAADVLEQIEQHEQAGIPTVWMTTGGARPDSLTVFAAAAGRTRHIAFGTSIVPTFPRHPLVVVQQVQVIAELAPGRFRLGVGPSHRPSMQAMGIPFQSPLAHLREYVRIVKRLLQHGQIDVEDTYYQAHETIPEPLDVPVMASALQRRSFELCGAEADGAISWICPGPYLRDVALPAMREGAA